MGYMALLRNLRNFDQAGVSDQVAAQVAARLADPAQVARSRQFPFRFLSAYRAAPSLRWVVRRWSRRSAAAVGSVPALPGRTLVLVDTSGSMHSRVLEGRHADAVRTPRSSSVSRSRSGAQSADVVSFSTRHEGVPGAGAVSRCCGRSIGGRPAGTSSTAARTPARR